MKHDHVSCMARYFTMTNIAWTVVTNSRIVSPILTHAFLDAKIQNNPKRYSLHQLLATLLPGLFYIKKVSWAQKPACTLVKSKASRERETLNMNIMLVYVYATCCVTSRSLPTDCIPGD
jgi:hypothetical protein